MIDEMAIACGCLAAGAVLGVGAALVRRKRPPRCRRCLFPVDTARPDIEVCPECGSDLSKPGAIATRTRPSRAVLGAAVLFMLVAGGLGLHRRWQLEQAGGLDPFKPAWVLELQLESATLQRRTLIASELVLRARSGLSERTAKRVIRKWREEWERAAGPSRFDPIAETLFPTGLVAKEDIERYTRQLLGFEIKPPMLARRGDVVAVESRVSLMGATRLRFEIHRAKFTLAGSILHWQPEPIIRIGDAGSEGSSSTISHTTTNYMVLALPGSDRVDAPLHATYSVDVYAGTSLVGNWSVTQDAPFHVEAGAQPEVRTETPETKMDLR